MSAQTSNDFKAFEEFYKANREHIDFKEKGLWDRLLEADTPQGFEFKITEGVDCIHLCVKHGYGINMYVNSTAIDPTMRYLIFRGQDAVDKLEQMLDDGTMAKTQARLPICVNALLGVVDDGVLAELYMSMTQKCDKVTGIYATAWNGLITIEY